MIVYKLTDQEGMTRGKTPWGPGVTHEAKGNVVKSLYDLCTDRVIHAYETPLLAVLMNPAHAGISDPILWEAEYVDCEPISDGLKLGGHQLRTIRQIPLPEVTAEQRTRFAILCALEVYDEPDFVTWANGWLEGSDRSEKTAASVAAAARAAAATAARTARAAEAAATAAWSAATAAWSAATAAWSAKSGKPISFAALAEKAIITTKGKHDD